MSKEERTEAARRQDDEYRRTRLLSRMVSHIGQMNAIGMGELYESVYDQTWKHRINDTRRLRRIITDLRREGVAICSLSAAAGGGYYLPAVGSELKAYLGAAEKRALKILARNSKIKRISLPEYLSQMRLALEAGDGDDAA